jgi:hypothetical protein
LANPCYPFGEEEKTLLPSGTGAKSRNQCDNKQLDEDEEKHFGDTGVCRCDRGRYENSGN